MQICERCTIVWLLVFYAAPADPRVWHQTTCSFVYFRRDWRRVIEVSQSEQRTLFGPVYALPRRVHVDGCKQTLLRATVIIPTGIYKVAYLCMHGLPCCVYEGWQRTPWGSSWRCRGLGTTAVTSVINSQVSPTADPFFTGLTHRRFPGSKLSQYWAYVEYVHEITPGITGSIDCVQIYMYITIIYIEPHMHTHIHNHLGYYFSVVVFFIPKSILNVVGSGSH